MCRTSWLARPVYVAGVSRSNRVLLVCREIQRPDERMQLLPRDSVSTCQSFELLVGLRTAVFAHDSLHSFCQHFPGGVEISSESLRVHSYLRQAMQQGVERHDRIAKR